MTTHNYSSFIKAIIIKQCSDSLMWYRDMVGKVVVYEREYDDCYMSREPAGYINKILKQDATIIDVDLNDCIDKYKMWDIVFTQEKDKV